MRCSLAFLYPVGGEPLQDVDLLLELSYALSQSQLLLSLRVALVLPGLYITTQLIGAGLGPERCLVHSELAGNCGNAAFRGVQQRYRVSLELCCVAALPTCLSHLFILSQSLLV